MFFNNWYNLFRLLVVGVLSYFILIFFLRITGKRTLAKMNAFDFIVTVAFGSTLATALLNKSISLAESALAFALLIGLQYAVTWSSVRKRWLRRLVTGEPSMLLYQGKFLPNALRRARMTEDEVRAAIRNAGVLALSEVEAVVLETDGAFSVIKRNGGNGQSSLADVPSLEERSKP